MGIIFEEWKTTDREQALNNKQPIALLVRKQTLGFEGIDNLVDTSKPFEMPLAFLNSRNLGEIILRATQGDRERWLRTLIRVYVTDGAVMFSTVDENTYRATLTW